MLCSAFSPYVALPLACSHIQPHYRDNVLPQRHDNDWTIGTRACMAQRDNGTTGTQNELTDDLQAADGAQSPALHLSSRCAVV